jgi:hypothetical protein
VTNFSRKVSTFSLWSSKTSDHDYGQELHRR